MRSFTSHLQARRPAKLATAIGLVLFVTISAPAFGQATRTWVSGVGDDANPCSRTAPCKTFAGAISKTAAGGSINVIDPGGFGAVTITKSITIDGRGPMASILAAGVNGIVINAATTDKVVLRNLDIQGIGTGLNGVRILQAKVVRVENATIHAFSQNGIDFEPTNSQARLIVQHTTISNNTRNGVLDAPSAGATNGRVTIRSSNIDDNGCGVVAASFGTGAGTCNTALTGATAARAAINVFRTSIADNADTGIYAVGSQAVQRLSANEVSGNVVGLKVDSGGSIFSFGNNLIGGNNTDGSPTGTIAPS